MIPSKAKEYNVQSTVGGERVAMGIDTAAMAHIMNILTDLYSDPEMAILREYSTNALDAHVEAGVKRPIEVTLPTALAPFFTVEDFGVGLDAEGIREVYSQYGASTKRGTNEQVGMLGLGCKSALTYTNQFVIVGTKDGERVQVQVSRDEAGAGTMTIVNRTETTDPNGVKVIIPAKRDNHIESKARLFFAFWKEGTVKVNGSEPQRVDGLPVGSNLLVVEADRLRDVTASGPYGQVEDRVVMGNVAYPANIQHDLPYNYKLVAFVPVGSVDFTPSREALHMTPRTRDTLTQIAQELRSNIGVALRKEVDQAKTRVEAVAAAARWMSLLGQVIRGHQWTYQGKPLPEYIGTKPLYALGAGAQAAYPWTRVPKRRYKLGEHSKVPGIQTTETPFTLWFTNYDEQTWTVTKRKKLEAWINSQAAIPQNVTQYIFLDKMPNTDGWIDMGMVFDYQTTIKPVKLATSPSTYSRKKIPGSYDATFKGETYIGEVAADDIDQHVRAGGKVFWTSGNRYSAQTYIEVLQKFYPDSYVVPLPDNRLGKFKRLFPSTLEAVDAVKAKYDLWTKTLTQEQKNALALRDKGCGYLDNLRLLDESRVKDPDLKAGVKLAKLDLTKTLRERKVFADVMGRLPIQGGVAKNPLDKYPLFSASRAKHPHMYLYLNAAYAASKP